MASCGEPGRLIAQLREFDLRGIEAPGFPDDY
jgi:hypothetical protein